MASTAPSWGAPCTRGRSAIPELPEVETVRRELAPWLTGRTIVRAARVDAPPGPKYARLEMATGARIEAVERRGKFLLLPLDSGDTLAVHLGMTGVLSSAPARTHVRVHLRLGAGPDPDLYFRDVRRFGRFLLLPGGDPAGLPTLAAMGPEPLSPAFTKAGLARALRRSRTPVKTYLLSQRPVAGVGNIYADEALWRARIDPRTPAERVSRARAGALRDAIRAVLSAALAAQGTTLNDYRTVNGGVGGYLERLDAYGHAEAPCKRCGRPLRRIVVGGRGTHLCTHCQRPPRRRSGAHGRGLGWAP